MIKYASPPTLEPKSKFRRQTPFVPFFSRNKSYQNPGPQEIGGFHLQSLSHTFPPSLGLMALVLIGFVSLALVLIGFIAFRQGHEFQELGF